MTFLMILSVILLSMLRMLLYTLYFKCYEASDSWQQLELVSELESDLRDTKDWCRKWLGDFNTGKTQVDGSVLEKKSFKMLGLTLCS